MPQQQWFGRLRGQIKDRCGVGFGLIQADGHGFQSNGRVPAK